MIKPILENIKTTIGILSTVAVVMFWVFNYHTTLATVILVNQTSLDSKIAIVETNVLIYTLMGIDKLDDVSRSRYDRATARLIQLEAQRDKLLTPK